MMLWRWVVVVVVLVAAAPGWGRDAASAAGEVLGYLQGLGNGSYLFGQMATWVHDENPDMDHASNWLRKVYEHTGHWPRYGCVTYDFHDDPFDDAERPVWMDEGFALNSRFRAALRIDPLLLDWSSSCGRLRLWGYDADALLSETALSEVRRFLDDWIYRTKALYMAVSLPPTWAYPEESPPAKTIRMCATVFS